jgi:PAS domain S-box-containing protein
MSPTLRILYAEDNALDADLTRAHFSEHAPDFEIEIVDTGQRCLDRLSETQRDLLLLGHRLPDMEGVDVLRTLVRTGVPVPVVLVTGSGDEDLVVKALRLGAANYVPKLGNYLETLPDLLRGVIEEHRRKQSRGLLAAAPRRILYVEHRAMDIELTLRHFAEVAPQFEIAIIHTCTDALTRLGQPPAYDAALIDLRMPDLDGLDFVREAKRRRLPLPPFIMISGQGDEAAAIASLKLGAADYVAKRDGYLDHLTYTIERAIAHAGLDRLNEQLQAELVERKRAEEALSFKNVVLSTQQETSMDGILVVNNHGMILSYSQRFADMWGIPLDIMESKSDERAQQSVMDKLANPEEFISRVKYLYATPDERSEDEIALRDGRTFDRYSAPMLGEDGRHFGRVWYFRDITARKQAEKALLESEERFRILFEQAADSILLLDIVPEGAPVIRDANSAAFRLLGYGREELIGQPLSCIEVAPDVLRVVDERRRNILAGMGTVFEVRHRCKDGTIREFECSVAEIQIGSRTIGISVERDITARKQAEAEREKLEEQLRASQKMEAIGGLAGGVAHDFNNLLSVILSFAGFALEAVPEGDPVRNDLLEVKKAGERAAALTRQLVAFSRKQVLQPVPLSLNQIATGVEKMLRRVLGEDIDLVQVLAPDLGLTLADPGQIEQVLMNLVVNARDAMPAGGKLTIETSNVEIDEEYAARHVAVDPGSYVQLTVTDTGSGMDEQTRLRIFEPFFTTKEKGKGTGLGLSTVYGIVKQSGGDVWVYSEPGQGTTFKIYLPRELAATVPATRSPPTVSKRPTGAETILVVEDEEALRNVARRTLETAGYTVLTAADGNEAVLTIAEHAGDIHLVVTDVVMPRMSGRVLAEELAKTRPTLRVLYMSGYTDDAIVRHGVLDAGTHFLGKPFTAADLARAVREVLDEGITRPADGHGPGVAADAEMKQHPLDQDAFRALPRDVLDNLRQAVIAARYDEIVEQVETLRITRPELAAGLRQIVDRFDYDGMRDLLGE